MTPRARRFAPKQTRRADPCRRWLRAIVQYGSERVRVEDRELLERARSDRRTRRLTQRRGPARNPCRHPRRARGAGPAPPRRSSGSSAGDGLRRRGLPGARGPADLLHSLVRSHALVDGNERLAWTATRVFCSPQRTRPRLHRRRSRDTCGCGRRRRPRRTGHHDMATPSPRRRAITPRMCHDPDGVGCSKDDRRSGFSGSPTKHPEPPGESGRRVGISCHRSPATL